MGDKTGIQWTDATWNFVRGCGRVSKGCENCLSPDTLVLMADMSWKPIGEIASGDEVVGFTDKPGVGQNRVFERSTVLHAWTTKKESVEISIGDRSIVSSVDHLFLSPVRPYWRKAERLTLNTTLSDLGIPNRFTHTESPSYLAGYIAGVVSGDGTFRVEGSGKNGSLQSYCRVAVLATDQPLLDRLVKALVTLGCEDIHIRPFDSGREGLPMLKVETRKMSNLCKIQRFLAEDLIEDPNWQAGFLAGFLDTDGSYSGKNLRFNQTKDNGLLDVAERAIRDLGFNSKREQYSEVNKSVILLGTLTEKIRFLSTIRPALIRKASDFYGRRFPTKQTTKVDGVRRVGVRDLVDIQTSSGTFIANGIAVHNCYAEVVAHRFSGPGQPFEGLTVVGKNGARWNNKVMLVPEKMDQPLRWTRKRMIFVNSVSDLFHKEIPFEFIAASFGVMAEANKHVFQILTKRPERARMFFDWLATEAAKRGQTKLDVCFTEAIKITKRTKPKKKDYPTWPLKNVWLGVSAEDQEAADKRIPILMGLPAAIRWVSYEPALGPVDFRLNKRTIASYEERKRSDDLHWIVVGGESGNNARKFNWKWAEDVVNACKAVNVKVFVKQMGSNPDMTGANVTLPLTKKGGDPAEWPKSIRVREYPR